MNFHQRKSTGSGDRLPSRPFPSRFFLLHAALLAWVGIMLLLFSELSVWTIAAMIAVAGAVLHYTVGLLTRPLTILEQGARAASQGALARIPVSRTADEVEAIGLHFNALAEKLEAAQRNRAELEEKVRQAPEPAPGWPVYAADFSHELRTAMNGLRGMLTLLQSDGLSPEQREEIEASQRCAESLLQLLNEMLAVSEVETGEARADLAGCDIRALAMEAVNGAREKAAGRGILVHMDAAPSVPARLALDRDKVRQILSALMNAGLRTTERGWVKLRLVWQESGHESRLVAEVIDTGSGEGQAADRNLAVARKLAAVHGGEILVDRQPGIGTVARLLLPCRADSSEEVWPPAYPQEVGPGAPPILVVEDNYVNQRVVTAMLRRRGYDVDVAEHGQEALQRLETRAYGLILMDVQMPVMDGFEATRRIRATPAIQNIPIVAMTALALPGDRQRCIDAGMDLYVSKPLNPTELLQVVEQQLIAAMTRAA